MNHGVIPGSARKPSAAHPKHACPKCGSTALRREVVVAPVGLFRPLDPLFGRAAVRDYLSSLGAETHEWLLALYLNRDSRLIALQTVACGDSSSCPVPMEHLINCAKALEAAGFVLVHNHPGGRPQPSMVDVRVTQALAQLARDSGIVLLDHFIVAGEELHNDLHQVCSWYWGESAAHATA
jgi:hypothetical protein